LGNNDKVIVEKLFVSEMGGNNTAGRKMAKALAKNNNNTFPAPGNRKQRKHRVYIVNAKDARSVQRIAVEKTMPKGGTVGDYSRRHHLKKNDKFALDVRYLLRAELIGRRGEAQGITPWKGKVEMDSKQPNDWKRRTNWRQAPSAAEKKGTDWIQVARAEKKQGGPCSVMLPTPFLIALATKKSFTRGKNEKPGRSRPTKDKLNENHSVATQPLQNCGRPLFQSERNAEEGGQSFRDRGHGRRQKKGPPPRRSKN